MRVASLIIFNFLVVLCMSFSCKIKQDKPTISFDVKLLNDECGSGFKISKEREQNDFFRKELEKYFFKAFIDNEVCEDISEEVFVRESFKGVVLEAYFDNNFLKYSIYDYESRWRESYINLLKDCSNEPVFYSLCDSLLLNNVDDGLIAVWDKDPRKLHYLERFFEKNKNDYYQVVQLIAVYHNSGMKKEKEQAINQLKKLYVEESESFLELLVEGEEIDYYDFMEVVYGGM